MPRYSGNHAYYQALIDEWRLAPTRVNWRTVEEDLWAKFLKQERIVERRSHGEIQRQVHERWGIKRGAYYRRLRQVRQRYAIP